MATLFTAAILVLGIPSNVVYADNPVQDGDETAYYDGKLVTSSLGDYNFILTAYERPSHEVIPIVSEDYFPTSTLSITSKVDNIPPSAVYDTFNKVKVDVVFAFGETEVRQQIQDYMPSFESLLNASGNSTDLIDAKVEMVETVTGGFDQADADVNTIYNFWDQYPNPNNYVLMGNHIVNAVFSWNGYPEGSRNPDSPINQIFIESNSYEVTDFKIESTYAWHGCCCGSGYIFRFDPEKDEAYVILAGNGVFLYRQKNISSILGGPPTGTSTTLDGGGYGTPIAQCMEAFPTSGDGDLFTVEMVGNTINAYRNGRLILTYTDPNPLEKGGVGLWAGCTVAYSDIHLSYDMTKYKSLGEAISDVQWRDDSYHIVIHATDVVPKECLPEGKANGDYDYTIQKLLASNCYLINLGILNINDDVLNKLVQDITTPNLNSPNNLAGIFYSNRPPTTGMDNAASYIRALCERSKNYTKYLLVNQGVVWETKYDDTEKDIPLNWGAHIGKNGEDKADITFAESAGINAPTNNKFNGESTDAERWRFIHTESHYDNSLGKATFSDRWISDHVNVFNQTGKYSVNYKRKDNPFTNDFNTNYAFNEYRYWSTNYDQITIEPGA